MTQPQPPSPPTLKLRIENREVRTTVISDDSLLSSALSDLLISISSDRKIKRLVGLDIQTCYSPSTPASPDLSPLSPKVALLKLCAGRVCLLVHLIHFKSVPSSLASFLDLPDLAFAGVGIDRCLAALQRDYGIGCRNAVDLGQLAATVKQKPYLTAFGLADLTNEAGLLNVTVKAPGPAFSDWAAASLTADQVRSATVDAFLSFHIGNQLLGGLSL